MYADNMFRPIEDCDPYISPNGTKFPWNFPKDEIASLVRVTETDQPTGDIVVTSLSINENYRQVWHFRPMTDEEISLRDAPPQDKLTKLTQLLVDKGVLKTADVALADIQLAQASC